MTNFEIKETLKYKLSKNTMLDKNHKYPNFNSSTKVEGPEQGADEELETSQAASPSKEPSSVYRCTKYFQASISQLKTKLHPRCAGHEIQIWQCVLPLQAQQGQLIQRVRFQREPE
jgi:hypothetical protein